MELPARPFVGRLLAEIAKEGGVPAAAAAMGVDPRVISALANGEVPSSRELNAIHTWLARRVALSRQEIEDYEGLRRVASSRRTAELERLRSPGNGLPEDQRRRYLVSRAQLIGGIAVLVVVVVVTVAVTATLVKSGNGAARAASPQPSVRSSSPIAPKPSPSASPTASAALSPTASAFANPPDMGIFHSNHISIAAVDSTSLNTSGSYYKDLSVNPPVTTTDYSKGDVDVLIGGTPPNVTMQADNGTTIGMWHQAAAPTYDQCVTTAEAAGVGEIDISKGQIVCIKTSSGSIASLKLISVNGFDSADFSGRIWFPPTSP